ncbi:S-adenosyl-L-methionine-dependent methyltransferase [Multifurca ochricompacta]|uniref:Histone-lysine N-methyltransferase, H3 lysine-79 specific n=1 Tax=Multifurca ochricompacta TaxID=376703 RepID=A0AAD4M2Q0_9AGAM|nr:S-adenosyl-L-methionine-dependent methyltransferase [Multifurca ochricompacta]
MQVAPPHTHHQVPFHFFPKSTSTSHAPPVVVKTRVVAVPHQVARSNPRPVEDPHERQSPQVASMSTTRTLSKRKSTHPHTQYRAKRARSSDSSDATPPPPLSRSRESSIVSSVSSSRTSTRNRSSPPTSVPPSTHSRSRSSSVLPTIDEPIPRECHIDEDAILDETLLSSERVVLRLMKSYVQSMFTFFYSLQDFKNPNDPHDRSFNPHPTDYPVGELEFPNSGATERYILLAPRDKDHYSPILDLERTLYTIIEHYLTPEQRSLFGTLPQDIVPVEKENTPATNHLRMLRRAVAICDGPLFMRTLDTINALLRILKYPPLPSDTFAPPQPNALRAAVAGWNTTGLPRAVALRIVEETYQRTVGPRTHELNHYQAFSDTVYGELMPSLVSRLLSLTRACPGMLLLDLGSGVGNIVLQAALQSGCSAFGVELMEKPAEMACEQRAQMMMRARMWGLRMGDVELEHANMLESVRVNELMARADVVLVNNKVFGEKLNEAIRPKFLDLKEGALVISLEPFVAVGGRAFTERNVDDISAILDVSAHDYRSMDVSWASGAGKIYVHRVDRAGYADVRARFEAARSTRSTRR